MYDVSKMFGNVSGLPESVVKTNQLMVAELEKVMDFQMKVLQSYVDMGLNQLKAAAEVKDAKSLQDFLNSQLEMGGVLREKMMSDAKGLADLSTGIKAELDTLTKENVSTFAPKAAA